ncbi:MAG TPA: glycosyltransferase family 39 protein [Herpetosiphonaceae bacterium]|nr:glycosyltransferase family 39 protein [Herpetosiphonaceae bacterium]
MLWINAAAKRYQFALYIMGALASSGTAAWLAVRSPLNPAAFMLWIVALAALLLGAWLEDRRVAHQPLPRLGGQRMPVLETAALICLTLLAFGLRAYDLAHYPAPFHGDEGEMGLMALRILEGRPLPPFGIGWADLPTLFYYLQAASLAVWGRNEVGLRMLSALWGASCIPLIYMLGRAGWGRVAGFTAAWLLTVSLLHIHFSRMALSNVHSTTTMIALMLLYALAYEGTTGQRTLLYAGAGLVAGLSQYLYYGSRLLPVVSVPLLWWLWCDKRANLGNIGTLAAAFVVAYAPLGWFFVNHWSAFTNRSLTVSVLSEQNVQHTLGPSATLPADLLQLLRHQLARTAGFFLGAGERSTFYSSELASFDPFTLTLFWLGLLAALAYIRRYHDRALLAWLGLGVLLAGVLTLDPPSAQRLVLIVPAVCLLGGVFVNRVWHMVLRGRLPRWQQVAPLVVAAAVTLALNVHTYFVDYPRITDGLVPITIAREMMAEPRSETVFFAGPPRMYANHGTIQFVAGAADPQELNNINQVVVAHQAGKGVLVVAVPERAAELDAIQQQIPGGTRTTHTDVLGRMICTAYRIPPER